MRRRVFIAVSLLAMLAFVGVVYIRQAHSVQVIGKIAPNDLDFVTRFVRQDLREYILPKVKWDNVHHLKMVFQDIEQYEKVHIFWLEAYSDGTIDVYAGVNKDLIHSEGYHYEFLKMPHWINSGFGYWGTSNFAPYDMHVPP
jgi:hypothetical protein